MFRLKIFEGIKLDNHYQKLRLLFSGLKNYVILAIYETLIIVDYVDMILMVMTFNLVSLDLEQTW